MVYYNLNHKKERNEKKNRGLLTERAFSLSNLENCRTDSPFAVYTRKFVDALSTQVLSRNVYTEFCLQYSYLAESVIVEMHTILLSNLNNWKTPFCKASITPAFKFSSLRKFTVDRCVPVYFVIVDAFFESLEFRFGWNAGGYSNDKNSIRNVIQDERILTLANWSCRTCESPINGVFGSALEDLNVWYLISKVSKIPPLRAFHTLRSSYHMKKPI